MCIIYLYYTCVYNIFKLHIHIMYDNNSQKIKKLCIDGNCNIYDSNNHLDYILQTSEHVYLTHKS